MVLLALNHVLFGEFAPPLLSFLAAFPEFMHFDDHGLEDMIHFKGVPLAFVLGGEHSHAGQYLFGVEDGIIVG